MIEADAEAQHHNSIKGHGTLEAMVLRLAWEDNIRAGPDDHDIDHPRVLVKPPGCATTPWAEISAPRIAQGPLFRTSRSWRIACVLAVTSSASPRASSRGTTRGDGSSSTRQRPRPPSPSRGPMSATTRRSSRRAGLMGPGVTAYLAPHFGCRLRQSRNSWNSSGLAAGGLPATPCCCFIKSLNFARSSGSCAFLSSHS
jgi:hypothetical protein